MKLTEKFREEVLQAYKNNRRDFLPWRKTRDPYAILVSEIMLQQTQADRVIPKYKAFLKKFPTVSSVAKSQTREILTLWQGLGYNRRALYLKRTCEQVVHEHGGVFPKDYKALLQLPGVGQSTAGAIMNFAFNIPQAFIETNIRTVYIHNFFKKDKQVSDIDILQIVQETLDIKNPREWFYALYDYGTKLKKELGKQKTVVHQQSKHYTKQSKFSGSNRQIRGLILKALLVTKVAQQGDGKSKTVPTSLNWFTLNQISKTSEILSRTNPNTLTTCLEKLQKEGLVKVSKNGSKFAIL